MKLAWKNEICLHAKNEISMQAEEVIKNTNEMLTLIAKEITTIGVDWGIAHSFRFS